MVNTLSAVDWAMSLGSNGVEIDLNFNQTGYPTVFMHGELVCDCTCYVPEISGHVCELLEKEGGCHAKTGTKEMLNHLANISSLMLVVIDSKIEKDTPQDVLETAGREVVLLMVKELLEYGYNGNVLIGMPYLKSRKYLEAAYETVEKFPQHKDNFVFSIDGEENNWKGVMTELVEIGTKKRVYGTGITSCWVGDFKDSIFQAYRNQEEKESFQFPYVWTLDKESSMVDYLIYGAQGIMTNRPGALQEVFDKRNIKKAKPGYLFPKAKSDEIVQEIKTCDCNYHPGGCRISKIAPQNRACHCIYKTLEWTCKGEVVTCKNTRSEKCEKPDDSKESCFLGEGDCEGY